MAVKKENFGVMPDGRNISLYTMTNKNGLRASVTDLGAVWVSLFAPDREGQMADVLLGYDNAGDYLVNGPHLGSVVGRIANRTAKGRFVLNGKEYTLAINNGGNNLHSGEDYYDRRLWEAVIGGDEASVTFFLESPDGDQGFPGNAKISVCYRLTDDNTMEITYRAESDADTPMNLTNHGYFNLAGHDGGSVLNHTAQIFADFFTPPTEDSIPTGEVAKVENTPMDFRKEKRLGEEIDADFFPLNQAGGYDHNWCLSHEAGVYGLAAKAKDPKSGRTMEVFTDLPGVQLYTANWLDGEQGKNGAIYGRREAFCFETQFYPDAVNKPHFPSPVIRAGQKFVTKTGYRFGVER